VGERREVVSDLVKFGISVHRACQLAALHRATFLYQAQPSDDAELVSELHALADKQKRYGYRRAWAVVSRTRKVNRKRIHRLWKQAQLQVKRANRPRSRRKRGVQACAAHPNHIWAYDFVQDADCYGNTLYILTIIDEWTRECLALEVARATSAEWVKMVLNRLIALQGTPVQVRSDNGAEFVALELQVWLAQHNIEPLYIAAGCPWQNGKDERFNGTLRDECLNMHLFSSLEQAQVQLDAFGQHYNTHRPHSALGYQTPLAFKQAWIEAQRKQQDSLIPT